MHTLVSQRWRLGRDCFIGGPGANAMLSLHRAAVRCRPGPVTDVLVRAEATAQPE